jgi:hypothetical protein
MRRVISFTATVLFTASALAAGDVYRWKDANGTWHYSDQPQAGAELVVRGSRPVGGSDTPAAAAPTPAPAATTVTEDVLPVSDAVAAEVRREAATAKAEQCKKADEAYQQAVRARRIIKTDGVTYMTDAEIDAERLRTRSARDLACAAGN